MTDKVNLLVIGEGGREFAIAKKLKESTTVHQGTWGCQALELSQWQLLKTTLPV